MSPLDTERHARPPRPRRALVLALSTACLLLSPVGCDSNPDPPLQASDTAVEDSGRADLGAEDAPPADLTDAESDAETDATDPDAEPDQADLFVDDTYPYRFLRTYGFFDGPIADMVPAAGVVPYDVASPLYSDGAEKARFIVLPEGDKIEFHETERWTFPVGTIVIKSFSFRADYRDPASERRVIETRLLVKEETGWVSQIYLWNDAQDEAERFIVGTDVPVEYIDANGESVALDYIVPDRNQCGNCHEQNRDLELLGPRTWQLARTIELPDGTSVDQLAWMQDTHDMFAAPLPDPATFDALDDHRDESAPLERRARSYLESNCAHCHNPAGSASSSGLNLGWLVVDPTALGVCRRPFAAGEGSGGRSFDIVPGEPDASIMVFRISSTDPEIKMPELPTRTTDPDGVPLIRAWIESMPGTCDAP